MAKAKRTKKKKQMEDKKGRRRSKTILGGNTFHFVLDSNHVNLGLIP